MKKIHHRPAIYENEGENSVDNKCTIKKDVYDTWNRKEWFHYII